LSEPKGARRLETRWDDSSRRLCMAWPPVAVGTDEDFAFDLIGVLLTSGRLSRLQRRLVHGERLATNVSTSNDTRVEGGSFWIYAECAPGVEPARLEAAIEEELARLSDELVPVSELRRARRILLAAGAYDNETITDLAEDLGEWAADADWKLWVESDERLEQVRPRDLRAAARRYLRPARRVVGWSLPSEKNANGSAPA
jgi:zinc protease